MAKRAKRASRPNPRTDRNRNAEYFGVPSSNVIPFNHKDNRSKKRVVEIIPRNIQQENLVANLEDPNKSIVFAVGPAGCGKTLLATLTAVKALKEGSIDKIVITRPNVAVDDKDIGFLPGDILSKMTPWLKPVTDVMSEYYSVQDIEKMMVNEIIEVVPIAFMRGRTFKNAIIIVDEAQGTTANSLLSILTRIGDNSKIIVTGDLAQSDRGEENGLADFLDRIEGKDIPGIAVTKFDRKSVQRHPIIKDVLKLYNQD